MDHQYSVSSVDEMIRNAELRSELEPYFDESLSRIDVRHWTIGRENDYLSKMLDWERAPVLPIAEWFNPPLAPVCSARLNDRELAVELERLIQRLFEKQIVLDFTDHLSDRALYDLIVCRILPTFEKKIDHPDCFRHWDCSYVSDEEDQQEVWLTYYATDEERACWEESHDEMIPPKRLPLYPRDLPTDTEF